LVDLAVNVRAGTPPTWLLDRLGSLDLAAYPEQSRALAAVAARHARQPCEVLLTAGAAEAFVLLARALAPRHALVVHPQFTEPEAALRAAGYPVDRHLLPFPFLLDPAVIPEDADLVVLGNPTNPTSVAHPAEVIASLARPGRVLVVDEAFADCLPGETVSLAGRGDLPGLVVLRSLTKTWGIAGLRAGYLLAEPDLIRRLSAAQPLWAVSTPALEACVACSEPAAIEEATDWARTLQADRQFLLEGLASVPGVRTVPDPQASFVLVHTLPDVRLALRDKGFAVRRGDTFPGLGPEWIRIAVRDRRTTNSLVDALKEVLA
jgi:histidinol-phosphate aminotransferase